VLAAMRGERPGYRIHVESFRARPVPVACQQCEEPACVAACPTGAVHRNAAGKPVLVDDTKCIGCSLCVQACPFGMMTMIPEGKVAMKCDLCVRRLAKGLQPACVSSCPTRALVFEEEAVYTRDRRLAAAGRMVAATEADRLAT
jgi:Fe-S-cluster-containing dehydrogenase component